MCVPANGFLANVYIRRVIIQQLVLSKSKLRNIVKQFQILCDVLLFWGGGGEIEG